MSVLYPDLNNTTFPNILDSIMSMLTLTTQDAPFIKEFQTFIQNGDFDNAQIAFNKIQNGNQKIISTQYLNTLRDCILALERFYKNDVKPYITTQQTSWQSIVDRLIFLDSYNQSTQYTENNYVTFVVGGLTYVYICTKTPPIGTPPSNATYWRVITVRGQQGPSGVGGAFRYDWNPATQYSQNDIVVLDNKWWVATQTNTNQMPFQTSSYWNIVLEISSSAYPVQPTEPTTQDVGLLWFQTIGEF